MPRTATITGPDGTTATMNIPDGATDEQIFTAADMARQKMAGTTSSDPKATMPLSSPETLQQTADVKAGIGSHILSGAKEALGGVGSSLMQDVKGILTPPPPHGLGEFPAPLENVGATLDLAGTAIAPEMTAAKVIGQVAGRAIGQSPEDAETTGSLASGAVGLAGPRGLVPGGIQALRAYRTAREAPGIASQAADAELARQQAALQATRQAGRADVGAAQQGISRAQQAADESTAAAQTYGQGAREAMGAGDIPTAGAQAQESFPAAAGQVKSRVQEVAFNPAARYAAEHDLALEPGTPQAEAVANALENTRGKWGPLLAGREKAVIEDILGNLRPARPGAVDTGILDASGGPITRVPEAVPKRVPYADLDEAALALTKIKGASSVAKIVGQAMESVLGDTPAAAWLRAGRTAWRHAVAPADRLALRAARADTPAEAFQRTVGSLKDPARALRARALLGENSPSWLNVRGGLVEKIIQGGLASDGTVDAAKLLSTWNTKVAPEVRALVSADHAQVGPFLQELTRLQETATRASEGVKVAKQVAGQVGNRAAANVQAAARNVRGARQAATAARQAIPASPGVGGMSRYLQHRAAMHGVFALTGAAAGGQGHGMEGALLGALGGIAVAGGIQFARPALTFLRGGATSAGGGAIAAKALASGIRAWSDQQPAGVQAHANVVADALAPAEAQAESIPPGPSETSAPKPVGPSVAASAPATSPSLSFPYAKETAAVGHLVGVDPALLHAVMTQESGHDATLGPNSAGAIGLMQILPTTFEHVRPEVENLLHRRADVNNGWDNLVAGALLYRDALQESHGDVQQAARLYHGGPNLAMHGPRTAAYAQNVAALYQRYRAHGN